MQQAIETLFQAPAFRVEHRAAGENQHAIALVVGDVVEAERSATGRVVLRSVSEGSNPVLFFVCFDDASKEATVLTVEADKREIRSEVAHFDLDEIEFRAAVSPSGVSLAFPFSSRPGAPYEAGLWVVRRAGSEWKREQIPFINYRFFLPDDTSFAYRFEA